jgi:hypothetical protein
LDAACKVVCASSGGFEGPELWLFTAGPLPLLLLLLLLWLGGRLDGGAAALDDAVQPMSSNVFCSEFIGYHKNLDVKKSSKTICPLGEPIWDTVIVNTCSMLIPTMV